MQYKLQLELQIKEQEARMARIEKLRRSSKLSMLKQMDPFEFEKFIKEMYELMGYNAKLTKKTNDGGKDIILIKDNVLSLVECKRYNSPKVTRPDIQKFHSALIDSKAAKGFFITTGEFTKPAIDYCKEIEIELINGEDLITQLESLIKNVKQDVEAKDLEILNKIVPYS